MTCSDTQVRVSSAVQSWFFNAFYKWGFIVAKNPKKTICLSFLLALLASMRLLMAPKNPLPTETRQEKLFAPQDSQGVEDYERYQSVFGYGSRRNIVYFTAQPEGANVLTSAVLAEVQRYDAVVRDQLYQNAYQDRKDWTYYSRNYSFSDLCLKSAGSTCSTNQYVLDLFATSSGSFDFSYSDAQIADLVNSGRGIDPLLFPPTSNRTIDAESYLGGIERDASGRIVKAASLKITYSLVEFDAKDDLRDLPLAFEDQLNYFTGPQWTNDPPISKGNAWPAESVAWSSTIITAYPNTAGAISRELRKSITGDVAALQIGLFSIALYAFFMLSRPRSPVTSRAMLCTAGIASAGFSIAIAYSMGALFKDVNQVINVLPFVLIGIGVDDMFVLINALESVPADTPVAERVATAMASAGVSITITSLTDFMAFLLGASSSLPGLASFCVFAAIGIFADFLLQISFFAGWMALDAHREAKQRADCSCCPCCPTAPVPAEAGWCKCYPQLQQLNKKYYVPLLRKPAVKAAVLVGFATFGAICLWQATELQQDFQRRWFVNSDAVLQQAYDVDERYYQTEGSGGPLVNVLTPPSTIFDYSLTASQDKLVGLTDAVAANKWIQAGSVVSWYPQLRTWIHACISTHEIPGSSGTCIGRECADASGSLLFPYCTHLKYARSPDGTVLTDSSGDVVTLGSDTKTMVLASGAPAPDDTPLSEAYVPPSSFYAYLDQYASDAPTGKRISSNLRWVASSGSSSLTSAQAAQALTSAQAAQGLDGAQLTALYIYTDVADDQIASMRDLRASVASAEVGPPGATYPFTFVYIFYEQFAIIRQEAYTNLGLALLAVFIITAVIIASLHASLMVILCVVLVDVDILGLMHMWGLTIDSVTIINLILAIGLSVDYSAHVAHAFVVAKGTRQERADQAVAEMGTAVVHGAASTFVAILVLASSKSYIFRVFFKQFFGICIFGAAHGLLFLPVLLSLVGPAAIDVEKHAPHKAPVGQKAEYPADKGTELSHATEISISTTPPTSVVGATAAASLPPSPPGSSRDCSPPSSSPPSSVRSGSRPVMLAWEPREGLDEA